MFGSRYMFPLRKREEDGEIVVELHNRGWTEVKRFDADPPSNPR